MDISSVILLVLSCVVSFALGRSWKRSRDQKRTELAQARQEQATWARAAEPPSKNKAKRKRQLQARDKGSRKTPG